MPERIFVVGILDGVSFFPVLALNGAQMASLVSSCNRAWDSHRPPDVCVAVRSYIDLLESIDGVNYACKDN